jgi:hypothetical protein
MSLLVNNHAYYFMHNKCKKNIQKYSFPVPVKKNTTTFELSDSKTNPVKFTWKNECNASYMYPVPVTIKKNG